MQTTSKKALFCYIPPKRIDNNDQPPQLKPYCKRYSQSVANHKNKIVTWDIYEQKTKIAHSQKLVAVQQEIEEYNDPHYNDAGQLKVVINKVNKYKKVSPIEYTILKSRD